MGFGGPPLVCTPGTIYVKARVTLIRCEVCPWEKCPAEAVFLSDLDVCARREPSGVCACARGWAPVGRARWFGEGLLVLPRLRTGGALTAAVPLTESRTSADRGLFEGPGSRERL